MTAYDWHDKFQPFIKWNTKHCNVTRTNPVGARNNIISLYPSYKADTTISLGMPTVSASGAIIGIASTARPEDEGTTNPKKMRQ